MIIHYTEYLLIRQTLNKSVKNPLNIMVTYGNKNPNPQNVDFLFKQIHISVTMLPSSVLNKEFFEIL